MTIINIDGVKVQVKEPEKDGYSNTDRGITPINTSSELGDSLKELNNDSIEPNTRMSGIDMRARLHPLEISSVLALDALVSLGILPTSCLAFTRQKKRLSVSLDGRGRDDIVNIVAGKREMDGKSGMGGMMDRAKSFIGLGNTEGGEK